MASMTGSYIQDNQYQHFAALGYPLFGVLIGISQMKLPHRAFCRITGSVSRTRAGSVGIVLDLLLICSKGSQTDRIIVRL